MIARHRGSLNVEAAARRAVGYSLLAYAFAYPDTSHAAALQEAAAAAEPLLRGTVLEEFVSVALAADTAELEPEWVRLFALSSSPDCPNFETAYFPAEAHLQTVRMADVSGFYRAFGVEAGGAGLRPDDISVELEFMGFLCRKEVYAIEHLGAPRSGQVVRGERMFLEEHLGQWAGGLGQRVIARAGATAFYRHLGFALAGWIAAECDLLGARPAFVAAEPSPDWAELTAPGDDDSDFQLIDTDEIPVT